tara:strand:- start:50 stop:643 length:594 start_codon:yes stop_codon:yes gene_type:complete
MGITKHFNTTSFGFCVTLFLIFTSIDFCISRKVFAQYNYSSPTTSEAQINPPSTIKDTISIQADGVSCSSGGGSMPYFYLGGGAGKDNLDNSSYQIDEINGGKFYQPYNGRNNFLAAGVGVVIPFGNQLADADCSTILAFVEADGYISILTGLQKLGVLDDDQIKTLGSKFLNELHGKLGLDPEKFTQQIKLTTQSK